MSLFADLRDAARRPPPQLAVVLGSGLSVVARRLQQADSVPYKDVPGLAPTTVAGHKGCLTLGNWAGRRVLVFEGRLHYYEGHPWAAVTLPVQIAHQLGARILLLTNAAGGIHAALGPGSFMVVRDNIEWTRPHAWRQPGPGALGPARSSPYSPRLIALLQQAARGVGLDLLAGVYAQVTGPSYEARAEI